MCTRVRNSFRRTCDCFLVTRRGSLAASLPPYAFSHQLSTLFNETAALLPDHLCKSPNERRDSYSPRSFATARHIALVLSHRVNASLFTTYGIFVGSPP